MADRGVRWWCRRRLTRGWQAVDEELAGSSGGGGPSSGGAPAAGTFEILRAPLARMVSTGLIKAAGDRFVLAAIAFHCPE